MKLLRVLISQEEVETDQFYWNLYGTNLDMPNFWWKPTNLQVEWYNDNPDRGGFTNYEYFTPEEATVLLLRVKESYDNFTGKQT